MFNVDIKRVVVHNQCFNLVNLKLGSNMSIAVVNRPCFPSCNKWEPSISNNTNVIRDMATGDVYNDGFGMTNKKLRVLFGVLALAQIPFTFLLTKDSNTE